MNNQELINEINKLKDEIKNRKLNYELSVIDSILNNPIINPLPSGKDINYFFKINYLKRIKYLPLVYKTGYICQMKY